jgi:hypothetical protein
MSGYSRRGLIGLVLAAFPAQAFARSSIEADAERLAAKVARQRGGDWTAVVDQEADFILIRRRFLSPEQPELF